MRPSASSIDQRIAALSAHWEVHLPEGPGPFPVVIQLHGCGGKKPFQSTWAEVAKKAGAAVIVVDSHKHRRISQIAAYATVCTGLVLPGRERAGDLFAAMAWARRQSWADPKRLIAGGWSHGGWTIADALMLRDGEEIKRATGLQDVEGEPLDGLVGAFLVYPFFGPPVLRGRPWRVAPKTLAIIGGRDLVAGGPMPLEALARAKAQGVDVEIVTFETATHAFDEPEAWMGGMIHDAALVARGHKLYADFIASLAPSR